jgi:HEAT repeat protein
LVGLSACVRDAGYQNKSADDWTRALASASPRDRAMAVAALTNIGPREWSHVRPLLLVANDPVPFVRAAAVAAIRRLPEGSSKALVRGLNDSSVTVRRAAALGLGHFRDDGEKAIQALVRATSDPDDSVRTLAVFSLGERSIGAWDAVGRIRQLASTPGPQRAAALLVLPRIDTESRSIARTYFPALNDTSAVVRAAAATMLMSAGAGHEAMPLLVTALRDPDARVRLAAANALAAEAPHDSVAFDAMVSVRGSADSLVRRLADSVLHAVQRPR